MHAAHCSQRARCPRLTHHGPPPTPFLQIVANWLVLSALSALFPALLLLAALNAGTSDGLGTLVPAFANPREPVLLYLVQLASGQLMLAAWISRNGWLRPVDTPVISWEAMLHSMCRVLFATKVHRGACVLLQQGTERAGPRARRGGCHSPALEGLPACLPPLQGIVHGLWSYYTQVPLNIRVTPKGPQGEKLMPTSAIWPFCVSAMLAAAAGLVQPGLALVAAPTALAHCIIPCLLVGLHYRDHHTLRSFPFHNAISLAVPIVTAASLVLTLLRHRGKWTARPRPPPSHAFTSNAAALTVDHVAPPPRPPQAPSCGTSCRASCPATACASWWRRTPGPQPTPWRCSCPPCWPCASAAAHSSRPSGPTGAAHPARPRAPRDWGCSGAALQLAASSLFLTILLAAALPSAIESCSSSK